MSVVEVSAARLGLPQRSVLPFGVVHALASDGDLLERVRAAVDDAIAALSLRGDAVEVCRKLHEVAHMGLAPSVAVQLGLSGERFEHLEHPMQALMRRWSQAALATMTDSLHTAELSALVRSPRRRAIADVIHLAPTGAA